MRFEGIYTPVITPHREDGGLDREAFAAQIDHLVASGVAGIVSGGSTGEHYAQSLEERLELMRPARERTRGRVPLIVGAGAIRPAARRRAHRAGERARRAGHRPRRRPADHVLRPPRARGREHGEGGPRPRGALAQLRGDRESSGDIDWLNLLARDYPHIQLSCGLDHQALEFFAQGARSWVCAGSNFPPAEHVALHRTCVVEEDFERGRRIMCAMIPLMRVLERGGAAGKRIGRPSPSQVSGTQSAASGVVMASKGAIRTPASPWAVPMRRQDPAPDPAWSAKPSSVRASGSTNHR